MPADIQSKFESVGGKFHSPFSDFQKKLNGIKAFIFDWDGVFNDGIKADGGGSPFSEIDSMGLNMLRFSYFLKHGFIPDVYIITGENNPPALHLSKREHFKAVYLKAKVKTEALAHILDNSSHQKHELSFMFDDILDLGLAAAVDLKFFVPRKTNPLLVDFVSRQKLVDYQTGGEGGNNAVREVCELCIGTLDNFDEVVELRVANDPKYQEYLQQRNEPSTTFFKYESGGLAEFQAD